MPKPDCWTAAGMPSSTSRRHTASGPKDRRDTPVSLLTTALINFGRKQSSRNTIKHGRSDRVPEKMKERRVSDRRPVDQMAAITAHTRLAGAGVVIALGCLTKARTLPARVKDHGDSFFRLVPHRKMSAVLKPMHLGGRKGSLRPRRLPRQTQPIMATPTDYNPL